MQNPIYQKSPRWSSLERIKWLERLNSGDEEAQAIEIAKCSKDFWYWLMSYAYTEDTHSHGSPKQPFPDKPHLFYLSFLLQTVLRLLVPKSRQLTVTWLLCAFYVWKAIHSPSRLIFFVSKKEEDADANIQRSLYIYNNLPKWYRAYCPGVGKNGDPYTYCNLRFQNRSRCWGIPSGGDQTRQYTASDIFIDEGAFQEFMKEQLASAIPTLGKRGGIAIVSSAAPSFFQDLVFDVE